MPNQGNIMAADFFCNYFIVMTWVRNRYFRDKLFNSRSSDQKIRQKVRQKKVIFHEFLNKSTFSVNSVVFDRQIDTRHSWSVYFVANSYKEEHFFDKNPHKNWDLEKKSCWRFSNTLVARVIPVPCGVQMSPLEPINISSSVLYQYPSWPFIKVSRPPFYFFSS